MYMKIKTLEIWVKTVRFFNVDKRERGRLCANDENTSFWTRGNFNAYLIWISTAATLFDAGSYDEGRMRT